MNKILAFILLFYFNGCDLLTTREAELPGNPRSNYQSPVTPEILIDNLVNSLKDKNVENYISCFSNPSFTDREFQFVPSSGAAAQYAPLFQEWDLKNEDQYFRNLISKVQKDIPVTLVFTGAEYSPLGDSLIFGAEYSLNVPHDLADLSSNFQGELRFSMIRDSRSFWSIYYWWDNKNSNTASWSELKGRFY